MGKLKDYITRLHKSSDRNYLDRMINNKVRCSEIAKKYDHQYWDGDRQYGYGGYKYMPGRWATVAQSLIDDYKLDNNSKILDVGCGKGFILHELLLILPSLKIKGIDISPYALENASDLVKDKLSMGRAQDIYPFQDKEFDLVISTGTLHNLRIFDLVKALKEIERVSKQSYLMVESYRNLDELFNLQCWALTCESFFDTDEWLWVFEEVGFKGDYEFIYFE